MRLDELNRTMDFDPGVIDAATKHQQDKYDYGMEDDYDYKLTLNDEMKKLGWYKIGNNSSYSSVFFNKSKPYILKINNNQDRAFAWFAFLTKKFPNPHFPNIGNMKVIKIGQSKYARKYYVYLIETLHEVTNYPRIDKNFPFCYPCQAVLYNPATPLKEITYLNRSAKKQKIPASAINYFKQNPKFLEALRILGWYHKNFQFDLHNENMMQRSDRTIVIIDPYKPSNK